MSWRSSLAAGAVLVAAVAAGIAAGSGQPRLAAPHPSPHRVAVTAVTLACPAAPAAAGSRTRLLAVGPGAPGTAALAPRLRVTSGAATLAATSVLGAPLQVALPATSNGQGTLVTATGALAAGVTAAELSTYPAGRVTGLAASACVATGGQWWFNGVDTSVGTTTRLLVTNPGAGVAAVDLEIFGPRGQVRATGAQGIAIAPESQLSLDLARFAPGRQALTLHVTVSRGTVAAAVSTTRRDAVTAAGSDWVAPSQPPASTVVVDSAVGGVARQRLVVTNPGPRQQLVAVRILDRDGAFVPAALRDVQVPPGAVVVKDITTITRHRASAVELRSATGVTGAIVSETTGARPDFAVSTVSEPLTAPAIVPTSPGVTLALAFTATTPAHGAVQIRGVAASGRPLSATNLKFTGLSTASWTLSAGSSASYVVVRSSGGLVQGVATLSGPAGITQLPVSPGRWSVIEPGVVARYP